VEIVTTQTVLICCEKIATTQHFKTVVLWLGWGKGGRCVPR